MWRQFHVVPIESCATRLATDSGKGKQQEEKKNKMNKDSLTGVSVDFPPFNNEKKGVWEPKTLKYSKESEKYRISIVRKTTVDGETWASKFRINLIFPYEYERNF